MSPHLKEEKIRRFKALVATRRWEREHDIHPGDEVIIKHDTSKSVNNIFVFERYFSNNHHHSHVSGKVVLNRKSAGTIHYREAKSISKYIKES